MKIYLIVHCVDEDINVFYTSREAALEGIGKYAKRWNEPEDNWEILVLEEGQEFQACFD